MDPIDAINHRRSTPSRLLSDPGPDDSQLQAILRCAVRAPDHGNLTPWRFLRIQGDERLRLGELLASVTASRQPPAAPAAIEKDRLRFSHAPLVLAVIARLTPGHKVPEQEQLCSGAAVCLLTLQAADALGFGAQWLTGWAAHDPQIRARLGLGGDERILGFVHIGTARERLPERQRPQPESLLSDLRL